MSSGKEVSPQRPQCLRVNSSQAKLSSKVFRPSATPQCLRVNGSEARLSSKEFEPPVQIRTSAPATAKSVEQQGHLQPPEAKNACASATGTWKQSSKELEPSPACSLDSAMAVSVGGRTSKAEQSKGMGQRQKPTMSPLAARGRHSRQAEQGEHSQHAHGVRARTQRGWWSRQ